MLQTRNRMFIFILIQIAVFIETTNGQNSSVTLKLSPQDLIVIVGETETFDLLYRGSYEETIIVQFDDQHQEYITVTPLKIEIPSSNVNETQKFPVEIIGIHPGRFDLVGNVTPKIVDNENFFVRITVANSDVIIYVSLTIGWIYFVAWSISFWPQIFINFKRKSVVGLSFDFLALNLLGHTLYAIFNTMMYWNSYVEDEYFSRHKRGLNPVIANDVGFSIHASFATLLTVFQCFIYERGQQRVSYIARGILVTFFGIILVSGILVGTDTLHLLDFLYILSYIKLAITLIKYVPQALLNYKRKSTDGWSIENILLDFTGGTLSMLQMILNSYNYDDWISIFGDPTKFGLGLFSVLFDILFIIQHYVLYKNAAPYNEISGSNNGESSLDQPPAEDSSVLIADNVPIIT